MPNVEKWKIIVEIILMLKPIIEWVVSLIESLIGKYSGAEKKAVAMTYLSKVIPGSDDPEIAKAVSDTVDMVVSLKNKAGEFEHYTNPVDTGH